MADSRTTEQYLSDLADASAQEQQRAIDEDMARLTIKPANQRSQWDKDVGAAMAHDDPKPAGRMTPEQLEANRKCPLGGGRDDCPCNGRCTHLAGRTMSPVGRTGTADDITLCAINTGKLYEAHCALARNKSSDEKWLVHTLLHVLPSYRADARTIEHFDAETVKTVAVDLKDYYTQHIAEG